MKGMVNFKWKTAYTVTVNMLILSTDETGVRYHSPEISCVQKYCVWWKNLKPAWKWAELEKIILNEVTQTRRTNTEKFSRGSSSNLQMWVCNLEQPQKPVELMGRGVQ